MPATIHTLEDLQSMVDFYLTQDAFCYDVETVGEHRGDPVRNRVLWISFATHGRADVLPLGHPNGDFIRHEFPLTPTGEKRLAEGKPLLASSYSKDVRKATAIWTDPPKQLRFTPAVADILRPLLFHPTILKVGQNIGFDHASIAKHFGGDIPCGPHFDTMVASFLLDNRVSGRNGLADIALREVGYAMTKGVGKEVEAHSFDDVARYAFLDARYTWLSYLELADKVMDEGMGNLMRLEMDLLAVFCRMRLAGAPIDVAALRELDESLAKQLVISEAEVWKAAGQPFQINSTTEKCRILYGPKEEGGQGLRPRRETNSGAPSVDQKALDAYAGKNKVVDALLAHSELAKLRSTYTLPYLGGMTTRTTAGKTKDVEVASMLVNGRIHTTFLQVGTDTGRVASRNPNLMNVPSARTANGKAVRSLFVAGPGFKLVQADFSQIEPRVLTDLSEDPKMLDAYLNGKDIYTTLADPLGLDRNAGKLLVLSMSYGIGDDKMAEDLKVTKTRVKEIKADFNKHFPNLERYKTQVIREAKSHRPAYVETLLGRRRYLPELFSRENWEKSRAERQAFNAKIQGSAADLMKVAMVRLDKAIAEVPDTEIILTIHDELIVRTPEMYADEVAPMMQQAMEGTASMLKKVPLVAEVHVVDNWSQAK